MTYQDLIAELKEKEKGCGKFNQIAVGGYNEEGVPNIENVYCGKNGYLCDNCKKEMTE